jgi:hypothetical protein
LKAIRYFKLFGRRKAVGPRVYGPVESAGNRYPVAKHVYRSGEGVMV